MLAALEGQPYTIPFSGPLTFCHVEDAALRFVTAISKEQTGAPVFDMNGTPAQTSDIIDIIKAKTGVNTPLDFEGPEMPFPAEPDNGALNALLGIASYRSLETGIEDTLAHFKMAKARGFDISALAARLTESS